MYKIGRQSKICWRIFRKTKTNGEISCLLSRRLNAVSARCRLTCGFRAVLVGTLFSLQLEWTFPSKRLILSFCWTWWFLTVLNFTKFHEIWNAGNMLIWAECVLEWQRWYFQIRICKIFWFQIETIQKK